MADDTLRDTFAKRLDPYLAIGTTPKDITPILDALIAAVRAENAPPVGSELDNLKRILKAKRQSDLS